MKKAVLGIWVWVVASAGMAVAADPETVWREALRTVVTTNGLAVATDTNVTTVASGRTPAYAGQWLFGHAGAGTNGLWVAKGVTTNDWIQLKP
jgi:hypothetical protein